MKLWSGGDEAAFGAFEQFYRRRVWSICRHVLLDTAEADDATQQTFVKFWLGRDSYTPGRPLWPWLRSIAVRTCLDHIRAVERLREVPFDLPEDDTRWSRVSGFSHGPEEPARMVELKDAFARCWQLMPGHRRALLQL